VKFFTKECERRLNPKKRGRPIVLRSRHPAKRSHRTCTPIEDECLSRKHGRPAADALPKPRYGMRSPDEPQVE
jgi:hypothetical protein